MNCYPQIFRSIGYRGVSVDKSVPFDSDKGIIPNSNGRILDSELYCATCDIHNVMLICCGYVGKGQHIPGE